MSVKIVKLFLLASIFLTGVVFSDKIEDPSQSSDEVPTPQDNYETIRGGCGSCRMREELKNRNLEAIKGEVLRRMGFETAPNITGRVLPQVPAHILAKVDASGGGGGGVYGMQSDEPQDFEGPTITEEEDDFHIKTETVLTFAQPYPRLRHTWRNHDILHFQFSDSVMRYAVHNATLFVYVKGTGATPTGGSAPIVHLEVYKVFKDYANGETPGLTKIAAKKVAQPRGRGDWLQLDVTPLVAEWFRNPRDNLGFVVSGASNGKKVAVTNATLDSKASASKVPFVEITTREARRRTRRSMSLNCNDHTNQSLCCRYPLTVNFESFGWDFVVAPKSYEAHYCSGDCPPLTLQKQPHTHLLHMASPGRNGGTCCAPRKMSAISMLYFDQNMNIVYGQLSGMVVDRCGCT